MKKNYSNPQTILMAVAVENVLQTVSPGVNVEIPINNNPTDGMTGAPTRKGLKYLSI